MQRKEICPKIECSKKDSGILSSGAGLFGCISQKECCNKERFDYGQEASGDTHLYSHHLGGRAGGSLVQGQPGLQRQDSQGYTEKPMSQETKSFSLRWVWWHTSLAPALGRRRQAGSCSRQKYIVKADLLPSLKTKTTQI